MFIFIIRAVITLIGVFLGNALVIYLQSTEFFSIINETNSNTILTSSINFGIIFCVAGMFFLLSSVLVTQAQKKIKSKENYIEKKEPYEITSAIISLIFGLTVSILLLPLLNLIIPSKSSFYTFFVFITYFIICSIVMRFSINSLNSIFKSKYNSLELKYISDSDGNNKSIENKIIVDTNIFIDGRITQIAKTGIFSETIIVPDFVINELQYIADSSDEIQRKKGKRGLDILNYLQNADYINIEILESNKNGKVDVDNLLITLAKQLNAKILSNDNNLCKVAKIKKINTINLNELAIALKPEFLSGDTLNVKPVKKGKINKQAISYLDDGTMIVIENAVDDIGKNILIEVTESIQSSQGKMIFAKKINNKI